MAQAALEAARAGSPDLGDWLEKAYAVWANKAEEELEAFTGTQLPKGGERASRPRLVWRSVLPEKRRQEVFPERAALVWLRGVAAEVQRITRVFEGAGGEMRGQARPEDEDVRPDDMWEEEDDTADHHDYLHADADYDLQEPAAHAAGEGDEDMASARERRARGLPCGRDQCFRILEDIAESLVKDIPAGEPTATFKETLAEITELVASIRRTAAEPGTAEEPPRLRGSAEDLRARLDAIVERSERDHDAEETSRWKKWIQEDFAAGARRAHAYTRLPMEAAPTATKTLGGAMSSRRGTPIADTQTPARDCTNFPMENSLYV